MLVLLTSLVVSCNPKTAASPEIPDAPNPSTRPAVSETVSPEPENEVTLTAASEALTPEPVSINVWHNLPPDQALALAEDLVTFKSSAPHISFVVRQYEQNTDLLANLETDGRPVDVVLGNAQLAAAMQARGRLEAIDGWFDPEQLAGFCPPAMTSVSRDDQVWGLPDSVGFSLLLYYNQDLVSTPPADTDEMLSMAQSLTLRDQWGLALNSYDPLWLLPWLTPYGGWLTDSEGTPTLDSPAMVDALTLYLGWHGRLTGVAPPAEYVDARQLFMDGKAAMLIDGDWAMAELDNSGGLNWAVSTLPAVGGTGQPAAPLILGRYWLVGSGLTKAKQAAVAQFLTDVTRVDRQLAWAERFGLLPAQKSALDALLTKNDPWLSVQVEQLEAGHGLVLGADANQILDAIRQPLRQVLDGDLVPEDAARRMQQAVVGQNP